MNTIIGYLILGIAACVLIMLKVSKSDTKAFIYSVYSIAFFGIAMAFIGFYGANGFNWKWNVFFLFPLYGFLGWALYKSMQMAKRIIETHDTYCRYTLNDGTYYYAKSKDDADKYYEKNKENIKHTLVYTKN